MALLSLKMETKELMAQLLDVMGEMTQLEVWFLGLMPSHLQVGEWDWQEKLNSHPGWENDWFICSDLVLEGFMPSITPGPNLAGVKMPVLLAKLNYLILLKEDKGTLLPEGWIEALTGGLPVQWSPNPEVSPPWLLRLAKAFGVDVMTFGPQKPDLKGVWLGTNLPPLKKGEEWEGPWLKTTDLVEHLWLQEADFGGFIEAISTQENEGAYLLYDTLWVKWEQSGVYLPGLNRGNRNYYTLRVGDNYHWCDNPHALWGNQIIRWAINNASSGSIGKAVNRDSTELVAPNRLYGDPSPLNKSQDRNTVGHLEASIPAWGPFYTGPQSMVPDLLSDVDSMAPIRGAEFAYEAGLPVLYQHQLETVRIGEIAAACGKSTIELVVKLSNGKLRKVKLSIGQFLVDKATKLFNRDSLLGRCPAVVIIHRKGEGTEEGKATLASFKAKAKTLLG